jgi:hypothetical protein
MDDKLCGECRRPARRLRKDRCDACYMRLYRNGELPDGAACAACGERRRVFLTGAELGVLCGNCALVAERTRPRVESIDDLRLLADRLVRVPYVPALDPSID